jgi:hypothetical protein
VPAIASVVLMALLSMQAVFSGRALWLLVCWFLLALTAQYLGATASGVWTAGLALQTALAVFLLLKYHVGQF